ncbi:hypothetical protein B0H15DRAFT_831806 [Mycena belliarum]|uniref:Uncharacterized protein n=1 Tax=Mycena belliarum TaxID=1033014 RepID=A0AAD6UB58_9AGAR|nr:hypothetical protein B0H15DRAFT_831806 [Mycena belliae]
MQISRILSHSSTKRLGCTRFHISASLRIPRTALPELPPPPLCSPLTSVQSITQANIHHYVAPLFERNWRVFMELPNLVLSDDTLERGARNVPMLGKKFWFLRGRTAANFLADVAELAGREAHEPRMTLFLGRKKQHVVVRMHTLRTLGETESISETHVVPGLSARDLRLALLLEGRFQDKYVASGKALPLLEMLSKPDVPDLRSIRLWHDGGTTRATETVRADEQWTPLSLESSPLPLLPDLHDAETICTNAHFDLYSRTLCLTGFFRFRTLAAAISFIREIAAFPWYKEDNAELHFLVDARTVRAQLVYPPEHTALTLGNLRAALRIEGLFHTEYVGFARMTDVHPYRRVHQPASVEELQQTRGRPLRMFHRRHNAKMGR